MMPNTDKCEVIFFTSNLHEARWQPTIQLEGQPLHFVHLPKLMGVTLDRAIPFGQHVANITARAAGIYHLTDLKTVGLEERLT